MPDYGVWGMFLHLPRSGGEHTHTRVGSAFYSSALVLAKVTVETWEIIYFSLVSSVWALGLITLPNYLHLHGPSQPATCAVSDLMGWKALLS